MADAAPTIDLASVGATLQGFTGFMTVISIIAVIAAIFVVNSVLVSNIVEYWSAQRGIRGDLWYNRLKMDLPALMTNPIIKSLTPKGGVPGPKNFPSYIEPATFFEAVKSTYGASAIKPTGGDTPTAELITYLGSAAADFDTNLKNWYTDVGNRVSGSYTRWTFLYLIVVGFVLAAGMDLDIYSIADSIANPPAAASSPSLDASVKALKAADDNKPDDVKKARKDFLDAWDAKSKVPPPKPSYGWQMLPATIPGWAAKVGSWVLAAFATSLGAQFWFNILSEALKIRGAGPKPSS